MHWYISFKEKYQILKTVTATYAGKGKFTIADSSNSTDTINVTVTDYVVGDVNCDCQVTVADVVLLPKWLLAAPNTKLANWKAADLCEDDRLDVFNLCLMKRKLVENS